MSEQNNTLTLEQFDNKISDLIEMWSTDTKDISIHEYLGFSEDDYAYFVVYPNDLKSVFDKYKHLPMYAESGL